MSRHLSPPPCPSRRWAGLALAALALTGAALAQAPRPPFKVTVQQEKAGTSPEPSGPVDPVRRINYNATGLGVGVRGENNETLHLSHFPTFHFDGQIQQFFGGAGAFGGRFEYMNRPLAQIKGRKNRE